MPLLGITYFSQRLSGGAVGTPTTLFVTASEDPVSLFRSPVTGQDLTDLGAGLRSAPPIEGLLCVPLGNPPRSDVKDSRMCGGDGSGGGGACGGLIGQEPKPAIPSTGVGFSYPLARFASAT